MRYISVNIAGLEISGGTGKIVLSPTGIDGWDDGVDMRRTVVDRPNGNGSYDAQGFLDARVVSISGRVLADSESELENIGRRITGLLANGKLGRLQVSTVLGGQWADCRLAARTRFTPDFGRRNATFQIQLWCADPRKFGESHEFRGSTGVAIPVYHRGNFDASPSMYVNGDMPGGYRLTCNGQTVTVTVPAVQGAWHSINFRLRRLRINGTVRLASFSDNQFWTIPPGQASSVVITPLAGGSGVTTINVTDTYI